MEYLAIYLSDHFSAAVGVIDLLGRMIKENSGTEFEEPLRQIRHEIEADAAALEGLMEAFGVERSTSKEVIARFAEKLGRLKMNGEFFEYSPLSRVLELEALISGVSGKKVLWQTFEGASVPGFAVDFGGLERRATKQRETLETLHARATTLAFESGLNGMPLRTG